MSHIYHHSNLLLSIFILFSGAVPTPGHPTGRRQGAAGGADVLAAQVQLVVCHGGGGGVAAWGRAECGAADGVAGVWDRGV